MKTTQLVGETVRLRPMEMNDAEGLFTCCQDARIWTHMSQTVQTREDVQAYVEQALLNKEAGTELPFVIIHQETNTIVGSTRFFDISFDHKRLELGHTWLCPTVWRTNVNTECKYLLLTYCFEQLKLQRVQIKTGHENTQSQTAIERIGATKEGILRNHMIRPNGKVRHTVLYSVIQEEWPEVKKHIENLMANYTN